MKQTISYAPDNLNIFPGFYESFLYNSDSVYNFNYNERTNFGGKYVDCDFDDFREFCKDVCSDITDKISELLVDNEIFFKCEYKSMSSPQEYNFTTDKLIMNVELDVEKLTKAVWEDEEMHKEFDKYLNKKYSSRDGFISFVANNIKEYYDEQEYIDVLVDYWLLTKIYDNKCVLGKDSEQTSYFWSICEIADENLYSHMVPISKAEWIESMAYTEEVQKWAREKFGPTTYSGWYGNEFSKRVLESGLEDELYKVAGIGFRYEEAENINQ